ncbi:hypothetical protein [Novosphingobium sp.]|uniref:hypothetical protein n=1 Tax=Novosphingobium sp. TaxID=1874826 RepID=UPI003BAA09F8
MKRRGGGQHRGSSSSLRVVLGATLALAGDTARRELTPPEGPAPDPPREVKKARRPGKLPEPRFAAAVSPAFEAAPARKKAAKREKKHTAQARADIPLAQPAIAPALAKAEPLPAPEGVLSAEFQRAIAPEPVVTPPPPVAEAPNRPPLAPAEAAPAPEPPAKAALAEADPLPAPAFGPPPPPPSAAIPAPVVETVPVAAEPVAAPAQASPALTPDPVQPPAPAVTETKSATLALPALPALAPPQPEAPRPAAPKPAARTPPAAAMAAPPPQPQAAPLPPPAATAPDKPDLAPPPVKLAEALPHPAFGGVMVSSGSPAETAAKPASTRLAYAPPPLPITPAAVSTAAAPTPAPAPAHTASRSFAESRRALPEPAFGMPAAAPKAALAASPLRANVTDQAGLGAATTVPVISDDDELILQIDTAQGGQSDTIVAYGLRQGVYLPLGALTRFLDLPIAVSDDGHYASGWFLDEKRTITLNLRDGTLLVAGRPVALGKGDAVAYEGELYLRAERFSDLFPLDLKVDLRAQTIAVKTREPFPFEERMTREADRERLASRSNREGPARFPREETPWRGLSLPVGETEIRALTDEDLGARVEADLRLAGDFAFMTARAYASASSRDGLTAARLELGRRDPDGDLLGPLKATEFQLGDVATSALPIGLRGVSGRGAFVTNAPLEQASIFDSVDLRGDLLDGYEVELYRNNALIGSTRTPVNGQYAFLQVPVDFGLNVFRLVFYGPQGQRREVVRKISVGDGRLAPGQFIYSVGAAQKDTNLFGVRGPRFSPAPDFGAWRATAQLGYGLNRAITATLGAATWESAGKQHWLAATGLRSGIGATALRLDLGLQDGGGHTVEVGLGGKVLGLAYSLTHAEYGGGAIDEVRAFTADPLRRASELNLNTTLHFGSGINARIMPITSQVRRIEFADGRLQTDAALRTTLPLGGVLLSNTLDYNRVSAPTAASSSRLLGTFDLATLSGSRTRYRASLGYGLAPTLNLQSVTLEADRRFGENTLVRGGVTHTLTDHQTTLGLSAIRRIGPVNVAFDGSYGFPTRNFSLALRIGFSFGRNPLSGRAFIARPGLTSGGAMAVTAFADANANGVRDPGEGPVAGVTFLSGTDENRTDANGRAFIRGLGDGARASVRVDSDSMPDIALAPARPGIEVVPRPGRIHTSDFAIVTLSDIEGTAYFRAESGTRAVSRLQLRLLRADGSLAAHARSESDGFFLFERLPAGEYHLELDPKQAASLKIRLEGPVKLTLGGKSSVLRQSIYVTSAN